MTEVTPVPAASVILLRGDPFEVLMIRRHEKASFVPNAWVFPGGAVDAEDERGSTLETMRAAAARELFEEAGIWLGDPLRDAAAKRRALLDSQATLASLGPIDLEQLVWTSRWITPAGVPKRFDTYFFIARAGEDAQPTIHENEHVDLVWITPADALARLEPVFPIQKNLEAIAGFTSTDELIASRHGVEIKPAQPVMIIEDGKRRFVLTD